MKNFLYIFLLFFSGNILSLHADTKIQPQEVDHAAELTEIFQQQRELSAEIKTEDSPELNNKQRTCFDALLEQARTFQVRAPLEKIHDVNAEYLRCLREAVKKI